MNTLNHLSFEKNGNTWLGHIIGTEREIELAHNSLYNFSATGTKNLDFITPNHATFWTTEKQMHSYLVNRNMSIVLNETPDKFRKQKGGALAEARKLATEQFAALNFDADARSFSASVHEYQFEESKEVQKVETFSNYMLALARGK